MNYDDVVHSRTNLENFDPSCIYLNKSEYYRNLGFSYYLSFAKTIDSNFLEKAIIAYTIMLSNLIQTPIFPCGI